jgi:hypothetical protein
VEVLSGQAVCRRLCLASLNSARFASPAPQAKPRETLESPATGAASPAQTCGYGPYIVKLEGLLEMRGLARLNLWRKGNRPREGLLNGQNAPSYQVRAGSGPLIADESNLAAMWASRALRIGNECFAQRGYSDGMATASLDQASLDHTSALNRSSTARPWRGCAI